MRYYITRHITRLLLLTVLVFAVQILLSVEPAEALKYGTGTDLDDVDVQFFGPRDGDRLGTSVDLIGDINGDGFYDVAMCSELVVDLNTRYGHAFIFFGGPDAMPNGTHLYYSDIVLARTSEDHGCWNIQVCGVGDVNGDGLDDFAIGVPDNSKKGWRTGKVYLFFGRTTAWPSWMRFTDANASFEGEEEYNDAGSQLSAAGDVNGDGLDDFLVAASTADLDSRTWYAGKAYLVLGKRSGWEHNVSLADVDVVFDGPHADAEMGAVAGAGDVNGDGYDDVLLGCAGDDEYGDEAGQAYLFLGPPFTLGQVRERQGCGCILRYKGQIRQVGSSRRGSWRCGCGRVLGLPYLCPLGYR